MYASRIWPFSDPYVFNVEKLLKELPEESKIFQGFNNETGSENMIVPNIIHSLRLKFKEYTFVDYLCLQAAFRHHRPDFIYIHKTNLLASIGTGSNKTKNSSLVSKSYRFPFPRKFLANDSIKIGTYITFPTYSASRSSSNMAEFI